MAEARISAEKAVQLIRDEADFQDILAAVVFAYTGTHVRHRQCQIVARECGCDPETVRRWLEGVSRPKAEQVWPIFFTVFLARLTDEARGELVHSIVGLG